METKKNSPGARRMKRSQKPEDNSWDCTVCTYRNTAEAFKCLMCDVRKGTSTRKPRLNPQFTPQVFGPASVKQKREPKERDKSEGRKVRPRLKNVDRSSPVQEKVTVNNVTVIITEFRPKRPSASTSPSLDCFEGASCSSNSNASFAARSSFQLSGNFSSDSNNSD